MHEDGKGGDGPLRKDATHPQKPENGTVAVGRAWDATELVEAHQDHHRNERNLRNVLKPDNILMVVDLLQEHDFAKRSLENVRFDDAWRLELRDPT